MIVKETLLAKAKSAFNLNEYETKTWTALLSRNESTAGELAEISSVPRSRVYDILESLSEKGFVIKLKDSPVRYRTVSPEKALEAAKNNAIKNAKKSAAEIERIKSMPIFKKLDSLYKKGINQIKNETVTAIVKGRQNIDSQLITLLSNTKNSLTLVTTKTAMLRKAEKLNNELKLLKDRGVSVKLAAPIESLEELPEQFSMAELKKLNSKEARFIVSDSKQLLLMLNHDKDVHESYDMGIWINSPYIAKTVEHFLENSWKDFK